MSAWKRRRNYIFRGICRFLTNTQHVWSHPTLLNTQRWYPENWVSTVWCGGPLKIPQIGVADNFLLETWFPFTMQQIGRRQNCGSSSIVAVQTKAVEKARSKAYIQAV